MWTFRRKKKKKKAALFFSSMERMQEGRRKTFLQVSKETGLCTTPSMNEVLERLSCGCGESYHRGLSLKAAELQAKVTDCYFN